MGESKRRKETDPNYGKVAQKRPNQKRFKVNLDPRTITPTEMIIRAVLFGTTAAVFLGTYVWQ